jgi:hypothetical protein
LHPRPRPSIAALACGIVFDPACRRLKRRYQGDAWGIEISSL